MKYIYDILLNFQDSSRFVDFFEWDEEDTLEQVKRIPLFRVCFQDMNQFIFSNIKVEESFLNNILKKSIYYDKNKKFTACLFCDLRRVVAIEFAGDGSVLAKSSLLLDEEKDVIHCCKRLKVCRVPYQVLSKGAGSFLTRKEEHCKNYLYHEILSLYQNKDEIKFNYLYEEVFGTDNLSFSDRYQKMMDQLNFSFDKKFLRLYSIVMLSYTKRTGG